MSGPGHILYVCTANQNRSPAAEAITRHLSPATSTSSRGTSFRTGYPMTFRMRAALNEKGIPWDVAWRSAHLTHADLQSATTIVVMDGRQALFVRTFAPSQAHKMVEWHVPDPNQDRTGRAHLEVVELLQSRVPDLLVQQG